MRTVITALSMAIAASLCLTQPRPTIAAPPPPAASPPRVSSDESKYIEQSYKGTSAERIDAMHKLGEMHAKSPEALAALRKGLSDSSQTIRTAAADGLADIGTVDSFKQLKEAADDGNKTARKAYDAVLVKLHASAARGDAQAKKTLQELGEPVTTPGK